MISEAIMYGCLFVGPFIILITLGAFIMEVVLPAIARRKARKRRAGSK